MDLIPEDDEFETGYGDFTARVNDFAMPEPEDHEAFAQIPQSAPVESYVPRIRKESTKQLPGKPRRNSTGESEIRDSIRGYVNVVSKFDQRAHPTDLITALVDAEAAIRDNERQTLYAAEIGEALIERNDFLTIQLRKSREENKELEKEIQEQRKLRTGYESRVLELRQEVDRLQGELSGLEEERGYDQDFEHPPVLTEVLLEFFPEDEQEELTRDGADPILVFFKKIRSERRQAQAERMQLKDRVQEVQNERDELTHELSKQNSKVRNADMLCEENRDLDERLRIMKDIMVEQKLEAQRDLKVAVEKAKQDYDKVITNYEEQLQLLEERVEELKSTRVFPSSKPISLPTQYSGSLKEPSDMNTEVIGIMFSAAETQTKSRDADEPRYNSHDTEEYYSPSQSTASPRKLSFGSTGFQMDEDVERDTEIAVKFDMGSNVASFSPLADSGPVSNSADFEDSNELPPLVLDLDDEPTQLFVKSTNVVKRRRFPVVPFEERVSVAVQTDPEERKCDFVSQGSQTELEVSQGTQTEVDVLERTEKEPDAVVVPDPPEVEVLEEDSLLDKIRLDYQQEIEDKIANVARLQRTLDEQFVVSERLRGQLLGVKTKVKQDQKMRERAAKGEMTEGDDCRFILRPENTPLRRLCDTFRFQWDIASNIVKDSAEKARAEWLEDSQSSSCYSCEKEFTFFRRRHHCRLCGYLFCATCSTQRHKLLSDHSDKRVCDKCFNVLKSIDPLNQYSHEKQLMYQGPDNANKTAEVVT